MKLEHRQEDNVW